MPKSYSHVTRDQRCQIYTLKANGFSLRAIAKQSGCAPSTISREIKRNSGLKGYRYQQADSLAKERRKKASSKPKKMTGALEQWIIEKLVEEQWSPEQIAGRLEKETSQKVSPQTIYRKIEKDKEQGGTLYTHLRHAGKKYYNRKNCSKAGRGCIPHRVDISQRPSIVERKIRIGDWEGDTIIGAQHQGVLVSYVDRTSKYLLLSKVAQKSAQAITKVTLKKFRKIKEKVHTITYDNGKEFAQHQKISRQLKAKTFFATPYHSWERGLNEHTNGLVRQYIPKKTNIKKISWQVIYQIEKKLNNRPRKVLNYKTPKEVFLKKSDSMCPKRLVALQC